MNKELCKHCIHFHQHYSLKTGRLIRVFFGHCTFFSVKARRPFQTACQNYTYGPADEDTFANKKFLTKEMVTKLFELEFLPPIEDDI